MKAVVAIPWRETPQRLRAFEFCCSWWQSHDFEVVTGDDALSRFNVCEARNLAVYAAQHKAKADIVILADADTIGDIDSIRRAIELAEEKENAIVYPFTKYRYLNSRYLDSVDSTKIDSFMPKYIMQDSSGGLMVFRPESYWNLGGMDERFESTWGFEDRAFYAVAQTLGNVLRVNGNAYSFSHDDGTDLRDTSPNNANYWRNVLYQNCLGKPKLMKELIK